MPKLSPADVPEVKLDSTAASVEVTLTREQRRGLFERPGTSVVAIVELTSKSYTGHAEGEDKDPQVKLRVTSCEAARNDEDAASLRAAARAMWRGRQMEGTLDEIGTGPQSPGATLDAAMTGKPTEDELKAHLRAKEERRRSEYVR